jgi:hypothetical protein
MIDRVRLLAVARKELLQLRRDPRSLVFAFLLPVLLTLIFGAAISLDVRDIPFAVLDRDNSADSRELVEAFTASGYFRLLERWTGRRTLTGCSGAARPGSSCRSRLNTRATSARGEVRWCRPWWTGAMPTPRPSRSTTPTR